MSSIEWERCTLQEGPQGVGGEVEDQLCGGIGAGYLLACSPARLLPVHFNRTSGEDSFDAPRLPASGETARPSGL